MPIAEIIQIIDGISRKSKLKKELAGLADPNFRSGVDIYNQANSLATGYSAQERNAFTQNLNRQTNTAYGKILQSNPTQAGAVAAALSFMQPQALNNFASQDANIKRSQTARLADMIRVQDNANQNLLLQKHQALGRGIQEARQSIFNGISGIENDAKNAALIALGMPPAFGNNKTTTANSTVANTPDSDMNPFKLTDYLYYK